HYIRHAGSHSNHWSACRNSETCVKVRSGNWSGHGRGRRQGIYDPGSARAGRRTVHRRREAGRIDVGAAPTLVCLAGGARSGGRRGIGDARHVFLLCVLARHIRVDADGRAARSTAGAYSGQSHPGEGNHRHPLHARRENAREPDGRGATRDDRHAVRTAHEVRRARVARRRRRPPRERIPVVHVGRARPVRTGSRSFLCLDLYGFMRRYHDMAVCLALLVFALAGPSRVQAADAAASTADGPAAWMTAAEDALRAHDDERAQTLLARVLTADPRSIAAHVWLGDLAFRRDALGEALEHYQAAARLDPNDVEVRDRLDVIAAYRQADAGFSRLFSAHFLVKYHAGDHTLAVSVSERLESIFETV